MIRNWTALSLGLVLAASACVVTPPADDGEEASKTEAPANDGDGEKTEAKIEADAMSDAPKLAPPPKAEIDRDCSNSDPITVDPAEVTPMTLPEGANEALTDPSKATEQAPRTFKVKFETTEGDFVVQAYRPWSPTGVDRFYNLVKIGFFDGNKFFRAVDGFMIQFGITGYPEVNAAWSQARIDDDPVKFTNKRGTMTFAKCGAPNCRSTQLFINTVDRNTFLDKSGFAPFAVIVEGMDVVDKLYTCYGDAANPRNPGAKGPNQQYVQQLGNAYLEKGWPQLSGIKKATILEE